MQLATVLSLAIISLASPIWGLAADDAEPSEFNRDWAEYSRYLEAEDYAAALAPSRRLYESVEDVFPANSMEVAAVTFNYGTILYRNEKKREAAKILKSAVRRFEALYGDSAEELVTILITYGDALSGYDKAGPQLAQYKRALKIRKQISGDDSLEYASLALSSGIKVYEHTQTTRGNALIKTAYNIYLDRVGNTDSRTGVAAFYLGKIEMSRRRYRAAEKHLLNAVQALDPSGPYQTSYLTAQAFLVNTYENLNRSKDATKHCLEIGRIKPAEQDQDYLPIFRKAPDYPAPLLIAGQSGHVDVEFTVDSFGFVKSPQVVDWEGSKGFDKAALKAVSGFRYAPRFEGGEPVATDGVMTRITFRFED